MYLKYGKLHRNLEKNINYSPFKVQSEGLAGVYQVNFSVLVNAFKNVKDKWETV